MEAISIQDRARCPCCGYPTLPSRANYDICELCNWEDDGQDDEDADEVMGGPNFTYSLTEARENFRRYMIMYAPGRDPRLISGESEESRRNKVALMKVFDSCLSLQYSEQRELVSEIVKLESALREEVVRRVREYEKRHAKG
jgi:hypothetical protein